MNEPMFFEQREQFRIWLARHAGKATELLVGFYKVGSGRPSMGWSESVDEALCVGWIDGVRRRIDDHSYVIRFTPRRPTSNWSAVNIAKFEMLLAQGRMTAAGTKAFANRQDARSMVYAYEQADAARLLADELRAFKREKAAWRYFEGCPPSYQKVLLHWVTTAKKEATRASRLATLIAACAVGKRIR
jgi:uncharacterized protein YdeI (YjbR/CyaY-like superfamily)